MRFLASIHDVTPATVDRTAELLRLLADRGIRKATLLVVPGSGWHPDALARLRSLARDGVELAGHGWRHRAERIRGIRHRLHSATISRDVAEHLALSRSATASLVQRCFDWFVHQGLAAPQLYVPPAWAMGRIGPDDFRRLPFRQYETLTGVYDAASGRFHRLPMVGFEADSRLRAIACRTWNRLNLAMAGDARPLRVAIHPADPDLALRNDLLRMLERPAEALSYRQIGSTLTP